MKYVRYVMLDKGNSDQSNKTVMTLKEQKNQANEFVARWKDRGNERQDSQPFWLDLFSQFMALKSQLSISLLKIRLCLTIPVSLMAILKRLKS